MKSGGQARGLAALCCFMLLALSPGAAADGRGEDERRGEKRSSQDSVVVQWNVAALEAVRLSRLGPPMVSRALAIIHTCMYDAWAAYDAKAVGTRLAGSLRRPKGLELFTGSDDFDLSVVVPAGSSRVEPGLTPATDLTLSWDTFSDAAAEAGVSRRYGGIHFEQGDLDARGSGHQCADAAWAKA